MFWHIFSHRIKCLVRDKEMMFWTLLFPLVLATFFNMAFSNLNSNEIFKPVRLAVVDNSAYRSDEGIKIFLEGLTLSSQKENEDETDGISFIVSVVSKARAEEMLKDNEAFGYLDMEEDALRLVFKNSGINQTIIKSVFEHYAQMNSMVTDIMMINPEAIQQGLIEDQKEQKSYFSQQNNRPVSPDNTLIYFYTVIAMACFYGGFMGMKEVDAIQADLTPQAARVNVAPTKKIKTFISSILAASAIQFTSILILLGYIAFILKADFGEQPGYLILLCASGCLTGVTFGAMICALIKAADGVRTAILIATTMILSFLAGMMQVQVKYIVTSAVPIMAYLNPLNVITDGFYSLYFYQTYTRYFTNIGVLWIFIVIFSTITILRLRRLKYASI